MAGCGQVVALTQWSCFSLPQNERYVVAVLVKHMAVEFDTLNFREKAKLTKTKRFQRRRGRGALT